MAGKADKLLTKLAFLNGETDKYKLAEIGGCCEKTLIDSWLPEFELERKKLYLSFRNSSLQLGVTESELNSHLEYIRNLREIADNLESEIPKAKSIATHLENIIEWLGDQAEDNKDLSKKEFSQACSMLKSYAFAKTAHKTATDQYIKVTNEWSKATGVEAHHSAAAARIKEAERLRGKDDAGRDPFSPTSDGDEANKASGDPFFGKTRKL